MVKWRLHNTNTCVRVCHTGMDSILLEINSKLFV